MIRTNSVQLVTIPNAIAYRGKLSAGDSAVVIIRGDESQPGTATISKSTGEPVISQNTPDGPYPKEAFEEAIALTSGMPYRKQGKPSTPVLEAIPIEEPDEEDTTEDEVVIDGADYARIVDAYTDKKGRLSYDLLNKDLIQLLHRSDFVAKMVAGGEGEDAIWLHVVGTRFRGVTGNRNLGDGEVIAIASLIDEVSPKGAFTGLNSEIRRMLSKARRA